MSKVVENNNGTYTIFVEDGTNENITLNIKDSDGNVLDLSSYTASCIIRDDYLSTQLGELIDGDGITLNSTSPNLTLTFSDTFKDQIKETTDPIKSDLTFVMDIRLTDTNDNDLNITEVRRLTIRPFSSRR